MQNFEKHFILNDKNIKDALVKLDKLALDAILFVVNDNNTLIGSLTDGDIRRGLIQGYSTDDSIIKVTQPNPKFIALEENNINNIIAYRNSNYKIIYRKPLFSFHGCR